MKFGRHSQQEILILLIFDLTAFTWSFFSVFNHWNCLPAMFFTKYIFGNAAFQVNAIDYPYCQFCCCCLRSVPFLQLYAHTHTWQVIEMSIQQYWGVGGWDRVGQGSPTELARLAVHEKAPPMRTRCEVGKHSQKKF